MPSLRPSLAALLTALALPAAAAPAAVAPAATSPAARPQAARTSQGGDFVPVLHLSVGTGVCPTPHSATSRVANPCWLQLGASPALRLGRLELGLVYEGRDLLKAVTLGYVRPPSVLVLGTTAGLVQETGERWRLSIAGEAGWRRYMDFAGSGVSDREGAADTVYLGATARAGLGLRPKGGRTDRFEVSLSARTDLGTARTTAVGEGWSAHGWSITMGVGLVSEW